MSDIRQTNFIRCMNDIDNMNDEMNDWNERDG